MAHDLNVPSASARRGSPLPTITALLPQPRRRGLVRVFLDGEYALTIHLAIAQEAALSVGRELAIRELQELQEREAFQAALDTAYRFLAHRSRSEAEVRRRLRRGRVPEAVAENVVARLRAARLLDDEAFARQWAENRAAYSPRSRRLVQWELRLKGVAPALAEDAASELDDEEAAHAAAARRAGRLAPAEYEVFRKKLWDFLRRRGFSYDVTTRAVERLWREQGGGSVPD